MRLLLLTLMAVALIGCGPSQIRINGKWIRCKEITITSCGAHAKICNDGMNHQCVTDFDTRN